LIRYPEPVKRSSHNKIAAPEKTAPRDGQKRSGPRPKIQDVAALAGVSLGSVSAVLNDKPSVSDATRARVQAAIEQLGYRPDLYASNLARRQTQVLGVVVSDLGNPFFAETAQALEAEAARHGYRIALTATNFSEEQHRIAVQQLLDARVAGIAIMTSEHNPATQAMVQTGGVPAVFLDVGLPAEHSTNIRVDARGGMRAAVEHLIALGHRDILFLRNSLHAEDAPLLSHRLRDQGLAAAVRAAQPEGLRLHTLDIAGPAAEAGEAAIRQALGTFPFTAVLCVTDMVALGACRGLQSNGLRVPEDVSVIGFDNISMARFFSPPLTTVAISREELSRMAVASLLHSGKKPQPAVQRLATSLILRESTARPNKKSPSMRLRRAAKRG
jgi:DNA-binding LacI/PurR family transcriptional regulator